MTLLQTAPKKQELPKIRQQRALVRGINLRTNANVLSPASFQARKAYMVSAFQEGKFLAEPEQRGKPRPNPMSDPAAMEGMMGMMKGNMAMMIPQTLIMGWINAFFSGFVISKFYPLIAGGYACRASTFSWIRYQLGRQICHPRSFPSSSPVVSLTAVLDSETSLSVDSAIQVNAPIRCWHARLGCKMGFQLVMVLPYTLWASTCVQFYSWKQQL